MHTPQGTDVKPDINAPLTRAEIDRVLMSDPPATYQAPTFPPLDPIPSTSPFGSAQPMKRTSDTDVDGGVFDNPSDNTGTGEAIPLAADGSVVADPMALPLPTYEPTAEEQVEAKAWKLEAGKQ